MTAGSTASDKLTVALDRRRIEIETEHGTEAWRIDRVRRASKQYGRFWALHFEDAVRLMSLVPMTPRTSLVLWHLLGQLDSQAWGRFTHQQVADALSIDRSSVTRAIGELKERGIIAEHPRRPGNYRLTLWLTWRGTAGDYQRARRHRQAEIDRANEWHTERAISNIDSDTHETDAIRYWRFGDDPTAPALRRMHREFADQPADRDIGQPPEGMSMEEWRMFSDAAPSGVDHETWLAKGRQTIPGEQIADAIARARAKVV